MRQCGGRARGPGDAAAQRYVWEMAARDDDDTISQNIIDIFEICLNSDILISITYISDSDV